ncbi:MAG: MerR family transcriptional regulator [Anaerolineae bacterium]|nr:MerR family transcriptional regulator [Anaerolineae bacterium]
MYTVKQLSDLAGVSVRTLHYYDSIGLLKPSVIGTNSYRYYDDAALLRLQQILFYREMGLELLPIKEILDSPDFDLLDALRSHRVVLDSQIKRLQNLIRTVDTTIKHLGGEVEMSKKQLFKAFSEKQQKQYEREARLQYGPELVNESVKRWGSYTKAKKEAIMEEGNQIYLDIVASLKAGTSPQSDEVQTILVRWHNHLRYFYEPPLEVLRGLGTHYNTHPEFHANFSKMHPDLPEYLQAAITQYADDLETAELERLMAEDAADQQNG